MSSNASGTPVQQLLAFIGLTGITVFNVLVYRISQRGGGFQYSTAAAMTCAEAVKLLMALGFLSRELRHQQREYTVIHQTDDTSEKISPSAPPLSLYSYIASFSSLRAFYSVSVLALMYAVNNQITFVCLTLMPPSFFNMFKSAASLLSALLMLILFKKNLPLAQWLALALQSIGLVVAQVNPCTGEARLDTIAYIASFVGVFLSALCGVWNAHIVKSLGIPLHGVNLILYSGGTILNLIGYHLTKQFPEVYKQKHPVEYFFQGFSPSVLLVIFCNSMLGLAITVVYKYADAIIKTLASSANTVIWMIFLGPVVFSSAVDPIMIIGCMVVSIATYMYLSFGVTKVSTDIIDEENNSGDITKHYKSTLSDETSLYKAQYTWITFFVLLTITSFSFNLSVWFPSSPSHKVTSPYLYESNTISLCVIDADIRTPFDISMRNNVIHAIGENVDTFVYTSHSVNLSKMYKHRVLDVNKAQVEFDELCASNTSIDKDIAFNAFIRAKHIDACLQDTKDSFTTYNWIMMLRGDIVITQPLPRLTALSVTKVTVPDSSQSIDNSMAILPVNSEASQQFAAAISQHSADCFSLSNSTGAFSGSSQADWLTELSVEWNRLPSPSQV